MHAASHPVAGDVSDVSRAFFVRRAILGAVVHAVIGIICEAV